MRRAMCGVEKRTVCRGLGALCPVSLTASHGHRCAETRACFLVRDHHRLHPSTPCTADLGAARGGGEGGGGLGGGGEGFAAFVRFLAGKG